MDVSILNCILNDLLKMCVYDTYLRKVYTVVEARLDAKEEKIGPKIYQIYGLVKAVGNHTTITIPIAVVLERTRYDEDVKKIISLDKRFDFWFVG